MPETYHSYPHASPVSLSHQYFPLNDQLQSRIGSPFGCFVTPFIDREGTSDDKGYGLRLARCSTCQSYINKYCDITSYRWFCSLCGSRNMLTKSNSHMAGDVKDMLSKYDILQDFRIPFKESDNVPSRYIGKYEGRTEDRPFIHVICIQEDMEYDIMQSVVEAILSILNTMHHDVCVMLITLSDRLVIYRLGNGLSSQYVHMASDDNPEAFLYNTFQKSADIQLRLRQPLSCLGSFMSHVHPIRSCRESLTKALNTLLDASTNVESSYIHHKVLEASIKAIGQWILNKPSTYDDHNDSVSFGYDDTNDFQLPVNHDDDDIRGSIGNDSQSMFAGILDLAGKVGAMILGDGGDDETANNKPTKSPSISTSNAVYSGIVMHMFISTKREISSISNDAAWVNELAEELALSSVCMNIYSIYNFESSADSISQAPLSSLASKTGGNLYSFVLGTRISYERKRIREVLDREVNRKRAMNCVMKIRSSPGVKVIDNSVRGKFIWDKQIDNIMHMCSCMCDSTVSFHVTRDLASPTPYDNQAQQWIVIQIAFSYETLQETSAIGNETPDDDSSISYVNSMLHDMFPDDINILSKANHRSAINHRSSPTSKLVTVRRMRIITVAVECHMKLSKLVLAVNPVCLVALILVEGLHKPLHEFRAHVEGFIISMLIAATLVQRESKAQVSYDDIMEVVKVPVIYRFVQLYYGAINMINSFHLRPNMIHDLHVLHDEAIEKVVAIMSMTPNMIEKFIYPQLYPLQMYHKPSVVVPTSVVSGDTRAILYSVVRDPMTLRREAMIFSQCSNFIMDTGSDIVIYNSTYFQQRAFHSVLPLQDMTSQASPQQESYIGAYTNTISTHRSAPISSPISTTSDPNTSTPADPMPPPSLPPEYQFDDALIYAPTWTINHISNCVEHNPIPQRIHVASAGSSSSDIFTSNMIEDIPTGMAESSFTEFVDVIIKQAIAFYSS